jgi:hypothetical protein
MFLSLGGQRTATACPAATARQFSFKKLTYTLFIIDFNHEQNSNFIGDECSEHDIAGDCTSDW